MICCACNCGSFSHYFTITAEIYSRWYNTWHLHTIHSWSKETSYPLPFLSQLRIGTHEVLVAGRTSTASSQSFLKSVLQVNRWSSWTCIWSCTWSISVRSICDSPTMFYQVWWHPPQGFMKRVNRFTSEYQLSKDFLPVEYSIHGTFTQLAKLTYLKTTFAYYRGWEKAQQTGSSRPGRREAFLRTFSLDDWITDTIYKLEQLK